MVSAGGKTVHCYLEGHEIRACNLVICAAGPGSTDGGAGGDEPWASKTSVYALLNSGMPVPKPSRPEIKEDPLLQMKKQKKMKKVSATV